ncbi:MAG: histidine kinase, partial [Actinomycetota bacterium]|nr:histidine kinase [Actinomycetota bacterium]
MPNAASAPRVDRWMLPGELARAADSAVDDSPTRPAPRTARDWAVDVAVFLFAVLIWVGEFTTSVLPNLYGLPEWIRVVDPILGAAACLALWWRRRFPLALGIGAGVAGALSNTAVAAVAVLIFSLALHRGWKWAVPVALAGILAGSPYIVMYFPGNIGPPTLWLIMLTLVTMLVVTMGLAVRARRQLVWALRLRADAALVDQQRQLEDSRRTERENIAREIHDTLAHRISLLSVHAGALEYRTLMAESGTTSALTAAEVRETVGVLRTNAHLALEELRDVLHVLHRDTTATD